MSDASWAERAMLLALLAVSGAWFWLRFRRVLEIIQRSRKTADFELAPWGPRIRQFLSEVVFQTKVIRQRPLPGLAHAFVFWGFCAFAFVTLNHFSEGAGFEFLSRGSVLGKFYFGFAAVFAVAVLVSITAIAIRRLVVRPKWLGHL